MTLTFSWLWMDMLLLLKSINEWHHSISYQKGKQELKFHMYVILFPVEPSWVQTKPSNEFTFSLTYYLAVARDHSSRKDMKWNFVEGRNILLFFNIKHSKKENLFFYNFLQNTLMPISNYVISAQTGYRIMWMCLYFL